MEYLIQTEGIGGVIIASSDWFSNISEELAYSLSIAIDIDGRTGLATDYLGQNWRHIWLESTIQFVDMCNSGTIAMLIFKSQLTLQKEVYQFNISQKYDSYINLIHFANLKVNEKDSIYFAEIEKFLVYYYSSSKKNRNLQTVEILPGCYKVYYSKKQVSEENKNMVDIIFEKISSFDNSQIREIDFI